MKYTISNKAELLSFISEPIVLYAQSPKLSILDLLNDKFKLVELIQAGLSFSIFEKIRTIFPFTLQDWSSFLDISPKSLQRYSNEKRAFKPIHSEKIIELTEVMVFGFEVFEDMDKLRSWLNTPSFALGHKKPLDLIKNSYGKELVMRELIGLEHGIFA
jgi:putative toxin-antitoxin system antitoxin component (TIGR02293 family)